VRRKQARRLPAPPYIEIIALDAAIAVGFGLQFSIFRSRAFPLADKLTLPILQFRVVDVNSAFDGEAQGTLFEAVAAIKIVTSLPTWRARRVHAGR